MSFRLLSAKFLTNLKIGSELSVWNKPRAQWRVGDPSGILPNAYWIQPLLNAGEVKEAFSLFA